jgi:uncharacterized protein YaaN involved in tellurite resistance
MSKNLQNRKDAVAEITPDIKWIIKKLQNDIVTLENLVNGMSEWSEAYPKEIYHGELNDKVTETLMSLTNNSNWVSFATAAIRNSK